MSKSGTTEAFDMEEFPKMPKNFNGFHVLPTVITIKCTSNSRISILDCAGILRPEHETVILIYRHDCEIDATDRFLILYTLVGMQWSSAKDANALLCWQRVKAQQVPTKSIIRATRLKRSKVS
ncbi:unnamed protein product [Cercopithifilaria johnstoni]|uniref:MSP domain-containing protein n=1 Tax=Cercopithifilaria johnstoni TaxID=2874296 RepID=A0A8J2PUI3_9BILA|nr:unnamed protein product [Cercopithifilaria johnstoni]